MDPCSPACPFGILQGLKLCTVLLPVAQHKSCIFLTDCGMLFACIRTRNQGCNRSVPWPGQSWLPAAVVANLVSATFQGGTQGFSSICPCIIYITARNHLSLNAYKMSLRSLKDMCNYTHKTVEFNRTTYIGKVTCKTGPLGHVHMTADVCFPGEHPCHTPSGACQVILGGVSIGRLMHGPGGQKPTGPYQFRSPRSSSAGK